MRAEREYSKRWLLLVTSGLLALLVLILAVGRVRAHFEARVDEPQTMQYTHHTGQIYILSAEKDASGAFVTDENGNRTVPEGWQTVTDGSGATLLDTYVLNFSLANGKRGNDAPEQSQAATLILFATEGIDDPAALTITLRDGGSTYVAVPDAVQQGSAWYNAYGPGWTFRFYNAADEELSWTFTGGTATSREMALTVSGAGEAAAILTLIVEAQPILN